MSKSHQQEIDKAINHLMRFQTKVPYMNYFRDLEQEVWQEIGEIMDEDPNGFRQWLYGESGMGHMAYGFLFEIWGSVFWHEDDKTPIEIFLKNQGWRESPYARKYLKKLNDSTLKIWEVTKVKPGEYVVIRDINQPNKQIRVHEKKGSENIAPWTFLAARVIQLGKNAMFTGAFLPLSKKAVNRLQLRLKETKSETLSTLNKDIEPKDRHLLTEMQAAIIEEIEGNLPDYVFTEWIFDLLNKIPEQKPELSNTDGDRMEDMAVRFQLTVKANTAKKYLDKANQLLPQPRSDYHWLWLDKERHDKGENVTVWGELILRDNDLTMHLNSQQRAETAKHYLKSVLGSRINRPLMIHSNNDNSKNKGLEDVLSDDISPQQRLEIIKDVLIKHYMDTLDEPVPMLDNLTPRTCAKNRKKRHKVIEWYKTIVSRSQMNSQIKPEDLSFILDELNIKPEEL